MEQQALYKTEQYFTYKKKKLNIRFIDEYYEAVPRPTPDERQLLKESILEDGLTDEIKINNEGIVLDGHTRIEICEELGWKNQDTGMIITPRYLVKEFKTKNQEREYVIKTNLMRRQLNIFQKVRLVASLYNNNKHSRREQTRYDILEVLKSHDRPMNSTMIGNELSLHRTYVLSVLRGLKEDYCVNYKEEYEKLDSTKQPVHYYYILPKGEGILYKGRPQKVILKTLGRSVGVGRENTSRAIFLLNHAPARMLHKLETGQIGVLNAYRELTKEEAPKRVRKSYLRGTDKVVCPNCQQVSKKNEWKQA